MTEDSGIIHVAGVKDADEAEMLIETGAEFLGLPLRLAYRPENLSADAAAAIVSRFKDRATFFLVTYLDTAPEIIDLTRQLGVGMVQLHGDMSVTELERLRAGAPDLSVIKSLVVRGDNLRELVDEMARSTPMVNAFITDTFDPVTGATGATGRTHDWTMSRKLVAYSSLPVILAGGLTADNVREAIEAVGPAGVDVHTGIEGPDGRKQRELSERFVVEARAGFAATSY